MLRTRDFFYVILLLYKVLVHPHQQRCVQFWSLHLKGMVELGDIWRRAAQAMKRREQLPYKERLESLGLLC